MKPSASEVPRILLVTPHLEPTLIELKRLLASGRSVDIYSSDTVEVQGERTLVDVLRFYWLDPLSTMIRLVPRVWRYRLIINYYHRNGYWLGLLGRVFPRRARAKLAWIGFAPNPRRSGLLGWIRENVTYSALLGHDVIVCNTLPVIATVQRRYPRVAERLAYARWGGTGDEDFETATDNGYIFTGGRTNRDFTTVFEALSRIDCPSVIVAGKDVRFPVNVPEHISIYRDISPEQFQKLLQGASVVVVALKRPDVSSGQVVLNRAMRSGKPVVVTATAGLDEYVTDGKDAVFVAPGDVRDLMAKLAWLLDHPQQRREIGLAARRTYETSFNSRVFARELFDRLSVAFGDAVSNATRPPPPHS
jgi:glycosyltransferase involved in cell wall biosynthesis